MNSLQDVYSVCDRLHMTVLLGVRHRAAVVTFLDEFAIKCSSLQLIESGREREGEL